MQKIIFFIFIVTAFILSNYQPVIAQPTEITLGFEDKEAFPYYMGSARTPVQVNPGASVEIVRLAANRLGLKVKWKRLPWKRCLYSLKQNKIDGTFNASYKPEREKLGVYPVTEDGKIDDSRRLVTVHYAFYKMKHSPIDWDGRNLTGLNRKIGVVLGYSVEKDLKKRGLPVDTAPNTLANIKKLLLGRVNLIAGSRSQIESFLNEDPDRFRNIVEIKTPLKVKSSYLILSHDFVKNNRELSARLWDTIRELRESEIYERIFNKYYNASLKPIIVESSTANLSP